jgi:acetyl esterase
MGNSTNPDSTHRRYTLRREGDQAGSASTPADTLRAVMKFDPCRLGWLVLLALSAAALGAEQDPSPKQLQKWLQRYPDADVNHDGTLSAEEARAYRQKLATSRKGKAGAEKSSLRKPTHGNVSYGPHKSNVLDLWLAESARPTPLVVFIHGGGFVGGDKSQARPQDLQRCLDARVSFMTINYRFRKDAPVQDILRDAARAIQFVRFNAARYNLDPKRIAAYGGSAGAGTSLWLAVHDDLADPNNTDPVLRQSSRIVAAGCINGQATYDLVEWEKVIGKFKPEWRNGPDEDVEFYHFKSHDDFNTPAGQKILDDCSMLRQITKGDAPIFMTCSLADTEPNSRNHLLHHPRHMQAVKQKCDEAGVEVHTVSTAGKGAEKGAGQNDLLGFLLEHLGVNEPKH